MIVTKENLVFLDNPKCGSSTMRKVYYPQMKNHIYRGHLALPSVNNNFHDYRYQHTGIEGSINYITKVLNKPVSEFKIICLIRNPYDRILSGLNHRRNRNPKNKNDLWDYIKPGSMVGEFLVPHKYRVFDQYECDHLIKCENLHEDVKKISDSYNLNLKIPQSNQTINKGNYGKHKFIFTDKVVDRINEEWELDFKDGNYPILTTEELNEKYAKKLGI